LKHVNSNCIFFVFTITLTGQPVQQEEVLPPMQWLSPTPAIPKWGASVTPHGKGPPPDFWDVHKSDAPGPWCPGLPSTGYQWPPKADPPKLPPPSPPPTPKGPGQQGPPPKSSGPPGAASAAASGHWVPAASHVWTNPPTAESKDHGPAGPAATTTTWEDFQSCFGDAEAEGDSNGPSGPSHSWDQGGESWDQSGQPWSNWPQWRIHRWHGYNSGGIASRARRGLKRLLTEEMRKIRESFGLPQSNRTFGEEAARIDSPQDLAEVLTHLANYRAGLERAQAEGSLTAAQMGHVEKAIPPAQPLATVDRMAKGNKEGKISGQERPRVPSLVPQNFSATGFPYKVPPKPKGLDCPEAPGEVIQEPKGMHPIHNMQPPQLGGPGQQGPAGGASSSSTSMPRMKAAAPKDMGPPPKQ